MLRSRFLYDDDALPSCHAGTIAQLADGSYLASFYAGTREGAPDVAIFTTRLPSLDSQWQDLRLLIDTPGKSEGNPVLHVDAGGVLHLYYVTQQRPGWDYVLMYEINSHDGGKTWSSPRDMSSCEGWMTKNKAIRLRSGRTVLPCYDEITWYSFCLLSDDDGLTWTSSGRMEGPVDVIQPTLLERADGSLLALMRSGPDADRRDQRLIFQSASTDAGQTWSPCEPTQLPNPNSGCDLVGLANGHVALAFNDTPSDRTPLTLGLSEDEGATLPILRDLEAEPGEYSYPAIIQDASGLIHVLYTWRRTRMKHVVLDEDWIRSAV